MVNHHSMNHMVNHHMNQSLNQGINQICQNMNQNQQLGLVVNASTCCGSYSQGANSDQPLTSPAAAATAPMQLMYQPPQARHCNCNSTSCNQHQHIHQCHPQPPIVGCRSHQSCGCMSQCGVQQICMVQHNCMPQPQQQYCTPQYHNPTTEKEEIQCGVVSQSSNNMRQAAYQRTLEYVEQCQSWAVSSSTHPPTSNMIINDMSSSLNSLMEENKYFQMIQWGWHSTIVHLFVCIFRMQLNRGFQTSEI